MTTRWVVRPSPLLDTLCLVGPLSGDPFYAGLYADEAARYGPRLNARQLDDINGFVAAIRALGGVAGPALCDVATQTAASTVAELIEGVQHLSTSDDDAHLLGLTRSVLEALAATGAEADWPAGPGRRVESSLDAVASYLAPFDVLPAIDQVLGATRPSGDDVITVILLEHSQPHSMRLDGRRFATHRAYAPRHMLRSAIHEMLHPLFDWATDAELREAFDGLRSDDLLQRIINDHDPALGYTTFEGYVEEGVVQAVDQLLNEVIASPAEDPSDRWSSADAGIHVLAHALYLQMRADGFLDQKQTITSYVVDLAARGALVPGWVAGRINQGR